MPKKLFLLLVILLAGCGPATPPVIPTLTAIPIGEPTAAQSELPTVLAEAMQQFSSQFNLAEGQAALLEYSETTWPDACLGLPQGEETCAAALTPGYRGLVLTTGGKQYELRSGLTGNARFVPGAAIAAQQALAESTGEPVEKVRFLSVEAVTWPDACLGVELAGQACAEVITPGYRLRLEASGQVYEYHTDRSGASLLLADTPRAILQDVLLSYTSTGELSCQQADIGREGVYYGPCEEPHTLARFVTSTRLDELEALLETYAPLEAETTVGKVSLAGTGETAATPAEQRMLAEWARLVTLESASGRSSPDWNQGISYRRTGGIAGFCDAVDPFVTGEVVFSDCRSGTTVETSRRRMTATELETLFAWIDRLLPLDLVLHDDAVADGLVLRLAVSGVGGQQASTADVQALLDFIQGMEAD